MNNCLKILYSIELFYTIIITNLAIYSKTQLLNKNIIKEDGGAVIAILWLY